MTHLRSDPVRTRTHWKALVAAIPLLLAAPVRGDAERPAAEAIQSLPSPLPLDWCLERAERANPGIEIDRASASAASARIDFAGALEDPRVMYEASNLPLGDIGFDATPLSGNQLGLKQKFPFPGLLSNREAAERAAAEAAEHSLDDRRLATASAVEAAWSELGFAQHALRVTDRNIELLRKLTTIAEARYRVGTGLQQDVLRAQVELTALLEERLQREAAISRSEARLAALLELRPGVSFPDTGALVDRSPLPQIDPLLEGLDQRSPLLRALAARVDQAKKLVRVATFEGYPEFDLGLGYRIRDDVPGDPVNGDDFLSAGVTIRLPIDRTKWKSRVEEQRALLRRDEATLREARAHLGERIRTAYAELVRADSQSMLLETGLVPQAQQSLESSRSAYEVGRIEFLSLLDSQVRLFGAELQLARSQADKRRAFATLESAAGEKLR